MIGKHLIVEEQNIGLRTNGHTFNYIEMGTTITRRDQDKTAENDFLCSESGEE